MGNNAHLVSEAFTFRWFISVTIFVLFIATIVAALVAHFLVLIVTNEQNAAVHQTDSISLFISDHCLVGRAVILITK